MAAVRRRAALCVVCLLGAACLASAAWNAAKEWVPDEWACSPANTLNLACPKHLQGDSRCDESFCPALAGCAAGDCHPFKGNVKADKMLTLDAYAVKGERCMRASFSISECCQLCKDVSGCNAWSYCNSADGCGSGCNATRHGFSWHALPQPWNDVDPTRLHGKLNPSHKCSDAGAWPYGTCSLKLIKPESLAQPLVLRGNQTGWVSGVVSEASAAHVDSIAFVLEADAEPVPEEEADSFGGLLEEDPGSEFKPLRSSRQQQEEIVVPPNPAPSSQRRRDGNGAGRAALGSGLLLAASVLAAGVLAAALS